MASSVDSGDRKRLEPMPKCTVLAEYDRSMESLPDIILMKGSLLDFSTDSDGCIVNAANEGCLGGGGIDGAVTAAGGPTLAEDRLRLPTIDRGQKIRCRTGSAVLTGPGDYGAIHVPYVIHAVGPNFLTYDATNAQQVQDGLDLLRSAYHSSLDVASSNLKICHIGFCLISAGIYRGNLPLEAVISHGISAIYSWRPTALVSDSILSESNDDSSTRTSALSKIFVFAYTDLECQTLVEASQQVFKNVA
jgi:O-acetyl-ADP-ribose deacetylase